MYKSLHQYAHVLSRLSLFGLAFAAAAQAQSQSLTVISFGGATKAAQEQAYFKPFERSGGGQVVAGEYNGEMAKVKAMVDVGKVSWDVVEVESPELLRGCDEGCSNASIRRASATPRSSSRALSASAGWPPTSGRW